MKTHHAPKKIFLKKTAFNQRRNGKVIKFPLIKLGVFLKFIPVFIFTGLILLILFLIKVGEISCSNQYGECTKELLENLGSVKGQSILSAQKNVKTILSNNFLVKKYSIRFKLPSKLVINILERKPKFALTNKDEGKSAIVDDEGKVLDIIQSTNLPVVYISSPLPAAGNNVDSTQLFSLKILSDIYKLYPVSNGELQDSGLIVSVKNTDFIFPREGDRKVLLGSLILIINQLNSTDVSSTIVEKSGSKITVDLRFDNPVIR